jgi:hypothetical protein
VLSAESLFKATATSEPSALIPGTVPVLVLAAVKNPCKS